MKIKLAGVAETLLIPLWARAWETTKPGEHLVEDPMAVELVRKIDYDFDKFQNAKLSQIGTAVRSEIFDRETKRFIKQFPGALCINLCCGLDTRFYRVDNGEIDWYDLDLPEVMALRSKLLPQESSRIHNIAQSVLNSDWPAAVQSKGRAVLIIMEGASMYFSENEMRQLLAILAQHFPGAVLFMEIMTPFLIRRQKYHDSVMKTTARFHWGVNDGRKIEALHPQFHFQEQWTLYEHHRFRWGIMGALSLIPWWNKNCNDKVVKLVIGA